MSKVNQLPIEWDPINVYWVPWLQLSYLKNRPVLALGSPGGWLIPHYIANALIGKLDFQLLPKEVVSEKLLPVQPNYRVLERSGDLSKEDKNIYQSLSNLDHQLK